MPSLPTIENSLARAGRCSKSVDAFVVWSRFVMNPDLPTNEVLDNPYQYTDYKSESTHGARGSLFGEE